MAHTLLFIPAPIHSHIIPALALAKRLKPYCIVFAVPTVYIEEINQAGFDAYSLDAQRFGVGNDPYVLQQMEHEKTPSYLREVVFYFSNAVYKQRQIAFRRILDIAKPYGILLDLFSSTDFIMLRPYTKRIIFISPMLSTHKSKTFPSFKDDDWQSNTILNFAQRAFQYINYRIVYDFFNGFNGTLILWYNFLINKISLSHSIQRSSGIVHFRKIPELVLAPLELEFDESVREDWQQYIGLGIDENRVDKDVDPLFEIQYNELCERKKSTKIVYCSFGTYGTSSSAIKSLIEFLDKLRSALNHRTDLTIILSADPLVVNFSGSIKSWPEHFFIYTKVSQLKALAIADLFITHAGLGSIKEAIHFGVPFVAFPLDPDWDQDGNALKIEYHKLGVRGSMHNSNAKVIESKIDEVLTNPCYRNNVKQLRIRLAAKYPVGHEGTAIEKLFSHHKL